MFWPRILIATALVTLGGNAFAQVQLKKGVISSGGAISGPTYTVRSIVGQPATGILSGPTYSARVGYAYGTDQIATAVPDPSNGVPQVYRLDQNFPNPFNPTTTIAFDLPAASTVRLVVYDVKGREVAKLIDRDMPAGRHRAPFDASELASGVYFYRMQAGSFVQTRKLVLMK